MRDDLDADALAALEARVAALEAMNPLQSASIDSGGNVTVNGGGELHVARAGRLSAGDGGWITLGNGSTLEVRSNAWLFLRGGAKFASETDADFRKNVLVRGKLDVKKIETLPGKSPSPDLRLVAYDKNGKLYGVPISAIGGRDSGAPGRNTTVGGWPISPFSYSAFSLNNYDGEADYGPRSIGKGWHDGIDYSGSGAWEHSTVRSIGPGVVIDPWSYCGGWAGSHPVVIKHDRLTTGRLAGKTLYSVYAHMWTSSVSPGQRVGRLQPIGTIGNDGQSYGAHLHLEIHIGSLRQYGTPGVSGSQDPVPIFNSYGGWKA